MMHFEENIVRGIVYSFFKLTVQQRTSGASKSQDYFFFFLSYWCYSVLLGVGSLRFDEFLTIFLTTFFVIVFAIFFSEQVKKENSVS